MGLKKHTLLFCCSLNFVFICKFCFHQILSTFSIFQNQHFKFFASFYHFGSVFYFKFKVFFFILQTLNAVYSDEWKK